MPAYLFSRKQKSLEYFFSLVRLYVTEDVSLEQIWATRDIENHFSSIKTLYRYHRGLACQIDMILAVLSREIAGINNSFILPDIRPDTKGIRNKLALLFYLLERLTDLLHQKHRTGIVLKNEQHAHLHYYFWKNTGIKLLDSS